ncbi:hypothetical protein L4D74_13235 [Vibrio cionasavignyae]
MEEPKKSRAVTQFYHVLDHDTQQDLTEEQKLAIEKAVDRVGLVAKHSLDVRKTFPWFGKRYYVVLLSGRDRRATSRQGESKWLVYATTALVTTLLLTGVLLALLALYLLKSALGIDIFEDFSLGIWDWFQSL